MPDENNRAKTRWQIEAEIDDAATARMNALLDRVAQHHRSDAIDGKLALDDDAWSDARAETLKYKLAQKQQIAELEKLHLLQAESAALRERQEEIERAARRADWERFRTVSTTMASGAVYFDPAQSNPVPKKPIEIPILTFPKRRINLKDVA